MDFAEFISRGNAAQQAVDQLVKIAGSSDTAWLRSVMANGDNNLTERKAAERQLKLLKRRKV